MSEAVSSKRARRIIFGGATAVVLVGVLAVGWQQAIWPLNQHSERALARRAQYFWDLKTSGDPLGAYNYMAQAYRRRVTPLGFANQGQGLVVHTGGQVRSVKLDEKGGIVETEIRYRLNKKAFAGMESASVVKERWLFENGAWYRWPPEMRG